MLGSSACPVCMGSVHSSSSSGIFSATSIIKHDCVDISHVTGTRSRTSICCKPMSRRRMATARRQMKRGAKTRAYTQKYLISLITRRAHCASDSMKHVVTANHRQPHLAHTRAREPHTSTSMRRPLSCASVGRAAVAFKRCDDTDTRPRALLGKVHHRDVTDERPHEWIDLDTQLYR